MKQDGRIIECVPNFSEGSDAAKIKAIEGSIRKVDGAHLLHIDVSPAANRTVMTIAGHPEKVIEAAFAAIKKAAEVIIMQQQAGVHPRIGATDVCPLVPLYNTTMDEVVLYSKQLGERVGNELNIPVYLYEYSANRAHTKNLPDIRKGQYEGFAQKMNLPDWAPDYGPKQFNDTSGATVIGARKILVAFNVSLDTEDVTKAVYIAERLRERGYILHEDGKKSRAQGLLSKVRAIGWYMADYGNAQVSMNLLDYTITSPLKAFQACEQLAAEIGTKITGAEVIGLIPEQCIIEAGSFAGMTHKMPDDGKLWLVHNAINYMKLNALKPFEPQEKILEYALHHAGLI